MTATRPVSVTEIVTWFVSVDMVKPLLRFCYCSALCFAWWLARCGSERGATPSRFVLVNFSDAVKLALGSSVAEIFDECRLRPFLARVPIDATVTVL
jgi:hypothetical protein